MKRLLIVFLLALGLSAPLQAEDDEATVEILWDSWGVPHIFAEDNTGIFYGFGWAMAHNHAEAIVQLYAEARGEAAMYFGAEYAESARRIRTLGIPQEGAAGYAGLDDTWRGYVDAFAAGVNNYLNANPDAISDAHAQVLPITGADILANGTRTLRWEFVARAGVNYGFRQAIPQETMGSNAWAVAPSRSASGNAMLVANPHQPWAGADFGLWMEAHFVTPELNLYGAALLGSPTLGIAFNDYLGWTHTVNTHDGWDLYALTTTQDGTHYMLDGEEVAFETREETFQILQDDGSLTSETITVRESLHGVVLAQTAADEALALRVVGEDNFAAARQWWEMGNATNLEEFEAALSDVRIPMFTITYADRDGNILHVFNEQVPIREEGDWEFWNGTGLLDNTPSLIPGDDSRYIWERNYHPYEDLPRVLNPESGWVQNANEPPYTITVPTPFDEDDFPAYMLPDPYIWPRPITSMRLMAEDESITFDELREYKQSTYVELARLVLDDLIVAAEDSVDLTVQEATQVLRDWDRQTNADSRGAVLFALWAEDFVGARGFTIFADPWTLDDPINSMQGIADPEAAVEALQGAATNLENLRALGIGMDVAYGDLFRLRYRDSDVDLPANGTNNLLGSFRVLEFTQDDDLRFYPTLGDSYIAIVEFGETVQAEVLLAYGNSTQSDSPHLGDQLTLFAEKEMRPALLTREAIEADLDRLETLIIP